MNVTKYNPLAAKRITRDEFLTPFDRLFDEFNKTLFPEFSKNFGIDFFERGAYPKVDVVEYEDRIAIEAGVPGMSKDDISIEIENDSIVISGNKQEKKCDENPCSQFRELKRSSFKRSFALSENIDKDNISAEVKDGILSVTLKKKVVDKQNKSRKIEIK